jgi:deazaflavin-dependent oxidoreductase (nitroreductase family)
MTTQNDSLTERLSRYREITLTVTGRKSGRSLSRPVWFVYEAPTLYLVPVQGSDTEWYKNVLKEAKITIDARGVESELGAIPIADAAEVKAVVEKFRQKYGAGDVKKYYSKFDVAVRADLR